MAEYIGARVHVQLKDEFSEDTQLSGCVRDVRPAEGALVLADVKVWMGGQLWTLSTYTILGSNIAELQLDKEQPSRHLPPQPVQPQPQQQQHAKTTTPRTNLKKATQAAKAMQVAPAYQKPAVHKVPRFKVASQPPAPPMNLQGPPPVGLPFHDPAIVMSLSSKPRTRNLGASGPSTTPGTGPVGGVNTSTEFSSPTPTAPSGSRASMRRNEPPSSEALGTLKGRRPSSGNGIGQPSNANGRSSFLQSKKESLERTMGGLSMNDAADSSAVDEIDDMMARPPPSYNPQSSAGRRQRRGGKGRQRKDGPLAPIAEPATEFSRVVAPGMFGGAIALAATGNKRPRTRIHRNRNENGNFTNGEEEGWATEDVNDYKNAEFDFQGNLQQFDKKTVFAQLKDEDTVAEEDRLVSSNRLKKPQQVSQQQKKTNFGIHENVLGTYANGQIPLSERDGWHENAYMDESDDTDDDDVDGRGRTAPVPAVESGRSPRRAVSRQSASRPRRARPGSAATGRASVELNSGVSSSAGTTTKSKSILRLATSKRQCPVVSPLQMTDVEHIAEAELGLTEELITENAARGIAQVAIQAFGTRISAFNHNALPVVLVFAGNNKSGARAIATGRHLKNHHCRVMVCVLGLEREDELLDIIKRQLNMFRFAGGRVARWDSGEMHSSLKILDSPPEMIIDALLGTHLSFEDLRTDDQATAFEMIKYMNRTKANVASIDIPSGVDASTGEIAQVADTTLYVRANFVVCMGAPKTGVVNALSTGTGHAWKIFVADIGISNTAWRKYGTRRRHGVEFETQWVVGLTFHEGG